MNILSQQTRAAFIDSLEIGPVHPRLAKLVSAGQLKAAATPSNQASGNVDAGSLVSFAAAVSSQHRSDALNCTLLAQLNSDKLFNRYDKTQTMVWYQNYTKVLSNIGWAMQGFQFQNYAASGSTFSIDTAIAGIVSAFLPAAEVAVVEATLAALNNLGSDDPWYTVWDQSSHNADGGNFQIAASNDNNGALNSLVLQVSAYSFSTTETTTRFLWTNYNSSSTELHYANETATLDEDVYSQLRQQIVEKLGANAATYIGNLEI